MLKETFWLRLFSFIKIPLIYFLRPTVISLDKEGCEIKLALSRRSKNHLNSMYFGALAAGADMAGGLIAMREIQKSGKNVSLVFKDFHAEFKKRATDDVVFICNQGNQIRKLVQNTINSNKRMELPVNIKAVVPRQENLLVAKFILTLSLKLKD